MKQTIKKNFLAALTLIAVVVIAASVYYYLTILKCKNDDPLVWESVIENIDKEALASEVSISFVGSSNVRLWGSLSEEMSPLTVENREFGGAKIPYLIHNAFKIILPYKSKIIVFYCGDNVMSMGQRHTAEEVLEDYKEFVRLVQQDLPETKVLYISIKPSKTRWEFWTDMKQTNRMIQQYSDTDDNLSYIDITSSMLDVNANPRVDILKKDGIHMNGEGYRIWTSITRPILEKHYL